MRNKDVQLLIGVDNPELFWTQDERYGRTNEPFAVKTMLGWSIIGGSAYRKNTLNVNFVSKADQLLQDQVNCLWKLDMTPNYDTKPGMSRNDRYAMDILRKSKKWVNGHYQLKLLWKPGFPKLKSNFKQANSRLDALRRRFARDETLRKMYTETIQGYVDKGFAERINEDDPEDDNCWYLPHHAVSHPRKPDKVRVVFDCAARFNGTSLNEQLLTGPDLLNNLFGVITRFRKGRVTLVADIESMYHQVLVDTDDRKYLKFLWWPNGNTNLQPAKYCMKVHVFGAASSPACANFALQQTTIDNDLSFSKKTIDTVLENFYMDDCLKSVGSAEEAIKESDELTRLLKRGGFNLTKWLSNSDQVISNFALEKRAKVCLDLSQSKNILHRVLGVVLDFNEDCFQIDVNVKDKPLTRRGILSQISAVFDPLGFVAPTTLKARLILQDLCRLELGWDVPIPEHLAYRWSKWISNLNCLAQLKVDRYFLDFREADQIQLHVFCDASQEGYGVVAYLRICKSGNICIKFVIGKSRLAPMKSISVPRLELEAATLAAKLNYAILRELRRTDMTSTLWTDSNLEAVQDPEC